MLYERRIYMKKQAIAAFLVLLAIPLMSGCGKQSELSNSATEESVLSQNSEEIGQEDTLTVEALTEDPLGLEINGIALTFPFRVEELSEELILMPKLYSEPDNYTLCDLSTTYNTVICSVFVQGKEPERMDSEIIGIIVDDMNDGISFCGLNDDTMTSYIEQYGEPNNQSDTFIEYTWESINFLVTFDDASHKADYVNLLVIQGN